MDDQCQGGGPHELYRAIRRVCLGCPKPAQKSFCRHRHRHRPVPVDGFRSIIGAEVAKNLDPSSVSLPTNHSRYGNEKVKPDKIFRSPHRLFCTGDCGMREDIFWKEEFEALAAGHPNFQFVLTLSQPSESWQSAGVRRGRVSDHVFIDEQNLMASDFYLCGNKPMVTEMEAALLAKECRKNRSSGNCFTSLAEIFECSILTGYMNTINPFESAMTQLQNAYSILQKQRVKSREQRESLKIR